MKFNSIYNIIGFVGLQLFVSPSIMVAQEFAGADAPASLGLPRLNGDVQARSLGSNRFQTDDLATEGHAGLRKQRKGRQDVLLLDGEASFSRTLRGGRNEVTFISLGLQGSIGTVADVGGIKIGITESAVVDQGYAQVMVKVGDDEWTPTGLHAQFGKFDGVSMAMLPTITLRLDPIHGVFDLYTDARLARVGYDYNPESGRRQIVITAGSDGAWLTGLVQSDDNPLYVDENANGIDDDFEQTYLGRLQDADAGKSDRAALIKEWHKMERVLPPPALFAPRPRPDQSD